MSRQALILFYFFVIAVVVAFRDPTAPAAAPATAPDIASQVQSLTAEIKALKELIPDQAHIMADVGYHFTNLWFAGKAANWPLADFYLNESRSHLHWAVRAKPIRKDHSGRDIDLAGILQAFENSQLTQLKQAVDKKDQVVFEAVYKESLTVCYACHTASDKPYLRLNIPTRPAVDIIHFGLEPN